MLPDSNGVSPAPPYLGTLAPRTLFFAYRTITPFGQSFQTVLLKSVLWPRSTESKSPATPLMQAWWFRLFRFRSPLLTESLLISLPPGTKMFQFPGCAAVPYVFRYGLSVKTDRVAPFGNSRIKAWLTAHRDLSQSPTSFIACFSQGIHTIR